MDCVAALEAEGWFLKPEEVNKLQDSADSTDTQVLSCYALDVDLRKKGTGRLPETLAIRAHDVIKGPIVTQVTEVIDVSRPRSAPQEASAHALFACHMNDGRLSAVGLALKKVEGLDTSTVPGTKLRLQNAKVRHGLVMLDDASVKVLGGRVEHLAEAWHAQQVYGAAARTAKQQNLEMGPKFSEYQPGRKAYKHRPPPASPCSPPMAPEAPSKEAQRSAGGGRGTPGRRNEAAGHREDQGIPDGVSHASGAMGALSVQNTGGPGARGANPGAASSRPYSHTPAHRGMQAGLEGPGGQGQSEEAPVPRGRGAIRGRRAPSGAPPPAQPGAPPRGQPSHAGEVGSGPDRGDRSGTRSPGLGPEGGAAAPYSRATEAGLQAAGAMRNADLVKQRLQQKFDGEVVALSGDGRGRGRGRGRRRRGYSPDEEDSNTMTLEQWERMQASKSSAAPQQAHAAGTHDDDEAMARKLQEEFDAEEARAREAAAHSRDAAADLASAMFAGRSEPAPDQGYRGRGGRGRRGRGTGGRRRGGGRRGR